MYCTQRAPQKPPFCGVRVKGSVGLVVNIRLLPFHPFILSLSEGKEKTKEEGRERANNETKERERRRKSEKTSCGEETKGKSAKGENEDDEEDRGRLWKTHLPEKEEKKASSFPRNCLPDIVIHSSSQ